MKRALGEFIIEGVHTNIDFQFEIINSDEFIKGTYDTKFIENNFNG
jgi:acetyl-CoA carboxylase biotin carboxylase subunit